MTKVLVERFARAFDPSRVGVLFWVVMAAAVLTLFFGG